MEGILTINFQNPTVSEIIDDSEKSLILEQRDWNPYNGKVTIGVLANAIANMIYDSDPRGGEAGGFEVVGDATVGGGSVYQEPTVIYQEPVVIYDPEMSADDGNIVYGQGLTTIGDTGSIVQGTRPASVNCSLNADGELLATLYAYPYPSSLNFNVRLTHGRITSSKQESNAFEEIILFRLSDNERTSYPVSSMQSSTWVGDVYDVEGAIVNPPSKSYSNNYFSLSRKIYGSLLVKYKVKRYIYELAIPMNEEEEDNKWDTVAYGIFDGGVSWEEIRGDESNSLSGTECTRSILSTGDSDGDDEDEEGRSSGRYTKYDYCTQDILYDHYR